MNLARTTDPLTSHAAAEQVNRPRLCAMFLTGLRLCHGQATAKEAAAAAMRDYSGPGDRATVTESIRKRADELFKKGELLRIGARKCGITGKAATVYEVRT